jgi:hypothetical protein
MLVFRWSIISFIFYDNIVIWIELKARINLFARKASSGLKNIIKYFEGINFQSITN